MTQPAIITDLESPPEPSGSEFTRLLADVLPDYASDWDKLPRDEQMRLAMQEADYRSDAIDEAYMAAYEAEKRFDRAMRLLNQVEFSNDVRSSETFSMSGGNTQEYQQ